MTEFVMDAYAWIELLDGSVKGQRVKKILDEHTCFTSAVTLAEVVSKTKRKNQDPQIAFEAVTLSSQILPVADELALQAGMIHAEQKAKDKKFGLADAFILASRKKKQKILTGDPHFKGIPNVEFLE